MKNELASLLLLVFVNLLASCISTEQCYSLSCVHAAKTTIDRMNSKINPCDDFYEYACGTFLEKTHPPDDKNVVDSLSLTSEKLTEQLLTLLSKPSYENESKLHKLAKQTYKSCLNIGNYLFKTFTILLSPS